MNETPENVARIGERILVGRGVPEENARQQIDLLLEAELRGYASHGLLRLPRIVERLSNGVSSPTATGAQTWVSESFLQVDGERGLGPVVAMSTLRAIMARARTQGIATAAVHNSNHCGMLAWYGEQVAREGLILIAMTTSEALVHPWGGRRAMIGTNPLCIAVPASPEPLVLDMATSVVSMGKIHDHANRGEPIPLGWALDGEGQPTTDPGAAKAGAIAPFGGPKGYALGLGLEVLVTALAGSAIGTDVVGTLDSHEVCNKGDVFIVIRPPSTQSIELISRYLQAIRECDPAETGRPVTVPGDRSRALRTRRLAEGVEIDDALWQDILGLLPSQSFANASSQ